MVTQKNGKERRPRVAESQLIHLQANKKTRQRKETGPQGLKIVEGLRSDGARNKQYSCNKNRIQMPE